MSDAISLPEFQNAVAEQSNAFASAWSTAAEKFTQAVAAEGGAAVVSAQRQYELLAQSLGQEFSGLAASSQRWAAAAEAQGNPGIAAIMNRYADKYAAQANALLDTTLSAEARVGALATEAAAGVRAAESAFGAGLGRAIGPAFDAYQMVEGALEWGTTGNSAAFGQAATGVVLSWTMGIAFGAFIAAFSTSAIGIAVFAGIGAGIGSLFGSNVFDWFNQWINGRLDGLFAQAETTSSPLILDLDGDGVETVSQSAGIHFDHDGNGFAEQTGWAGADDGLLVWDRNANGQIDSGAELFGNNTLLAGGAKAANGFAALTELDGDADGDVDADDAAWTNLRVWRDTDQDGVADDGELLTLDEAGVVALNTGYTNTSTIDAGGNAHKQAGSYKVSGGGTAAMNKDFPGVAANDWRWSVAA